MVEIQAATTHRRPPDVGFGFFLSTKSSGRTEKRVGGAISGGDTGSKLLSVNCYFVDNI